MKKVLIVTTILLLLLLAAIALVSCASMGASPKKDRTDMYQASANYKDGTFRNVIPVNMKMEDGMISMAMKFFLSNGRKPKSPLPTSPLSASDFSDTPQELQIAWLGHSSTILDIDGIRLLIDPVFDSASPIPFIVNRFQPSPIKREDLPRLDAIIISHDHYDHLEMKTIKHLISRVPLFIVPLGVGAHLEKWGCQPEQIVELDWWQSYIVNSVEITATPSRHFSGRGFNDRFKTLWASFVFKGPKHNVFYSGDGGFDDRFKEIGTRFGPFDLTMIEIGAWNTAWPDVHMFPEQSIKAHMQLHGKYMLPVHWAAYDLSFHNWDDPILLASKFAEENNVELLIPKMGEICIPGKTRHSLWWGTKKSGHNVAKKNN
jgi:L-ascorbate metabolism protein UlaG (beta-lactamase superfamily)